MANILPGYARQVVPNFSELAASKPKEEKNDLSFPDIFKEMVNNTNDLQSQATEIAERFMVGEVTDIHEVMIAAEEAGVALELVMEVRNKLVEAYQEMMRMAV